MTVSTLAAQAIGSIVIDKWRQRNTEEALTKLEDRLRRACEIFNVGCIDRKCWSNCGPRYFAANYCFTRKSNATEEVSICKDYDCEKFFGHAHRHVSSKKFKTKMIMIIIFILPGYDTNNK